ncbi:MAG: putative formamidopyrimidine-DNA glycosylase [Phycisphaerae bacterium]|nr:MAG: putative formamidopyrimidine-DNA glycosylase [Phycisphaerae bacterium]
MPELPDVTIYVEALRRHVVGAKVLDVRIRNPFLVRTVDPPLDAIVGKSIEDVERFGKRIVLAVEGDLFVVIHLMIAGRLLWRGPKAKVPAKIGLLALDFEHGSLILTEAGTKRRASIHVACGREALSTHDPGGLEVIESSIEEFASRLRSQNHTIKRALTDPKLLSGIGNAYSDEILHAAKLSPMLWTSRLDDDQIKRLHDAVRSVLIEWTDRLREQFGERFPDKGEITAHREDFAVHNRFGKPCLKCGATVQRIRYKDRETNYCPTCQTGGKKLSDRSLARLLKDDWQDCD